MGFESEESKGMNLMAETAFRNIVVIGYGAIAYNASAFAMRRRHDMDMS